MIRLASFRPEFFNANGDQGNLEVLEKQIEWRGGESETTHDLSKDFDFLLIGDASRAAMREFEGELLDLVPVLENRLANGKATLLVGSAHEFYAGKVIGLKKLTRGKRRSEFRSLTAAGVKAFGYRNSEVDVDLVVSGAFISTTLFGPVLAKSPDLLERVLQGIGITQALPEAKATELNHLVEEIRSRSISG